MRAGSTITGAISGVEDRRRIGTERDQGGNESRIAMGVRIAAGPPGSRLPGLLRRLAPRLPLAIGALLAGAAALGALFLGMMLMMFVGVHGLGGLASGTPKPPKRPMPPRPWRRRKSRRNT